MLFRSPGPGPCWVNPMRTGKIPHSFSVFLKGVKPIGTQAIGRAAVFRTRPPLTLCAHTHTLISGPLTHSKIWYLKLGFAGLYPDVNGPGNIFLK